MKRTVLIDADILAFQVATSQEEVYDFNGKHVLYSDLEKGIGEVQNALEWIKSTTKSQAAALFLTGSNNFRTSVLPSYKANRKGVRRPMILRGIREWMLENTKCFLEDTLEGDDLIGIHATKPHKGERVVYSADKDLRTIPGFHWDSDEGEVVTVTEEEADRFFHEQILTGDPVDNYKGCPSVGKAAAAKLLDGHKMWVEHTRVLKSGPRKGEEVQEWRTFRTNDPWVSIVSAYLKAGLTEKDALQQARCARILRHGEYDFKKQKVNLWTPHQ